MRIHRLAIAAAIVAAAPSTVSAQRANRCAWSPKGAWVQRQAAFFDDSKHDWTNDSLRTALLDAAGLAGTLAAPFQTGVRIEGRDAALGASSATALVQLKQLAATRGSAWPTKSVVGSAGTHAVYLLVRSDTALARTALHRMMEAGPAESPAADVAMLEDQLRLVWGRKQIYGTQFRVAADGRVLLAPMEDSTHADLRREGAGLPPFKLGICLAEKQR